MNHMQKIPWIYRSKTRMESTQLWNNQWTGTAKIMLTDFDVPNISSHIDTVTVFVYSDRFLEGIDLTLYETGKNSGVFERTFSLRFTDFRNSAIIDKTSNVSRIGGSSIEVRMNLFDFSMRSALRGSAT
ncbi:MAG: hypothetical protein OER82_11190 [Nitrosopumilus sp.]|nr:hypothetical protein [Nitrosopumilus sp.]